MWYCKWAFFINCDIITLYHTITFLFQVFIIFKYFDVVINRNKMMARVAYIHCLTSSILFWFSYIEKEIMHKIVKEKFPECPRWDTTCPDYQTGPVGNASFTCITSILCNCSKLSPLTESLSESAAYLLPFSLEYSVLVGTDKNTY